MRPDSTLATGPARSRGFVLISALLILIVMTILALSMARSFVLQQRLANNLQDKTRAFQLAQSTLQYAESVVRAQSQNLPRQASCGGALAGAVICGNAVAVVNPSATTGTAAVTSLSSWAGYTTMQPAITVSSNGGNGTYYAFPRYYIQYLGLSPGGAGALYLVTAMAYGGTPSTVAVVQSTYQVTSGFRNIGGL
jgi:type IV pilus assembly protein PilX